jgi:hypothetical protein
MRPIVTLFGASLVLSVARLCSAQDAAKFELPHWRIAFQTESAFGVSGSFYNHLAGARLDRCFSSLVCLGGYVGYANLKGKDGRVSEILPYAQLEARPALGKAFFLPFRFGAGYLPKNGPTMRVAAGLGYRVGDIDLTLEIAPTYWLTGKLPVISIDPAIELAWTP